MYRLIYAPEAKEDLRKSYHWHEDQKSGLGDPFLIDSHSAESSLQNNPKSRQILFEHAEKKIRRFGFDILALALSSAHRPKMTTKKIKMDRKDEQDKKIDIHQGNSFYRIY